MPAPRARRERLPDPSAGHRRHLGHGPATGSAKSLGKPEDAAAHEEPAEKARLRNSLGGVGWWWSMAYRTGGRSDDLLPRGRRNFAGMGPARLPAGAALQDRAAARASGPTVSSSASSVRTSAADQLF